MKAPQLSMRSSAARLAMESFRIKSPLFFKLLRPIYKLLQRVKDLVPRKEASNFSSKITIYIDISSTLHFKHIDGIRRINIEVMNYLATSLELKYQGFRIIPVQQYRRGFIHSYQFDARFGSAKFDLTEKNRKWNPKMGDILLIVAQEFFDRNSTIRIVEKKGVRIYSFIHDIFPITNPEWFPPDVQNIFNKRLERQLKFSHRIILLSQKTFRDLFNEKNLLPIRNLISQDKFRISSVSFMNSLLAQRTQSVEEHRKLSNELKIGVPEQRNRLKILILGTLEPRKGLLELVEVLESKSHANIDALEITLIGRVGWIDRNLLKRLRILASYSSSFAMFTNASDQLVNQYLCNTDYLLMTSLDEGYGLPVLEAEFLNIPVIVRDIPIFHEVSKKPCIFFSNDGKSSESLEYILAASRSQLSTMETMKRFRKPGEELLPVDLVSIILDSTSDLIPK